VFESLYHSGLLQKFIDEGKEYVFISNVENFGGVVGRSNFKLLNHLESNKDLEFISEVTERHLSDHLGGILVQDGQTQAIRLLELSQVPQEHLDHFKANKFKYWNTNSIWIRLANLKKVIESNSFQLSVIANLRKDDDKVYLQLEMPAATAIQNFTNSVAMIVPRIRYCEVKTTADLLVLQSNLFQMTPDGSYSINPARPFNTIPVIKLGDHFSKMSEFSKRFKGSLPDLLELDHLTVSGDVYFGNHVTLKGNVIIVANHGEQIHIPDGAQLENKIIAGNMRILDH